MRPYTLQVKFGKTDINITINSLLELIIIQDINKYLPEFRLRVRDITGFFTHLSPSDSEMNNVEIDIGCVDYNGRLVNNNFKFKVYTKRPESLDQTESVVYNIAGLLNVDGLMNPTYSRGFSGKVSNTLKTISSELTNIDKVRISPSLDYNLNILQPKWTNIQLLNDLKNNLSGEYQEYGYKCNIQTIGSKNIFKFISLTELLNNSISYKFIVNDEFYKDRYPVYKYEIYDYNGIYRNLGLKAQRYGYFDYYTSQYITEEEYIEDYLSLSKYYLVDTGDTQSSNEITTTGRTNDFNGYFGGRVRNEFANKINNLVKMRITTHGLPNIVPGQIVQIFFPQANKTDNLFSFQYAGYWLVENVVHNIGNVFLSQLLLTRSGLDTNRITSMLKARKVKR